MSTCRHPATCCRCVCDWRVVGASRVCGGRYACRDARGVPVVLSTRSFGHVPMTSFWVGPCIRVTASRADAKNFALQRRRCGTFLATTRSWLRSHRNHGTRRLGPATSGEGDAASGSHRDARNAPHAEDGSALVGLNAHHPASVSPHPVISMPTLSTRVSVALSATLQLGSGPPNLPRTTDPWCRPRAGVAGGAYGRVASQRHSVDRVLPHAQEVDRADPATDRKMSRRDVVVEAEQPPDLNRRAAAVLLRILLEGASRGDLVQEGEDRSVQSQTRCVSPSTVG